jgi:hypothetical protein
VDNRTTKNGDHLWVAPQNSQYFGGSGKRHALILSKKEIEKPQGEKVNMVVVGGTKEGWKETGIVLSNLNGTFTNQS